VNMTKGVMIGLVGGIVTIVATLLPWASNVSVGDITLTPDILGILTGFGTIVLILGVIGLVLALLARGVGTMVCGIIALLFSIFWMGAWSFVSEFINITGSDNAVGYGTYLSMVGAILLIVGGVLLMGEKKKAVQAPPPMQAPPMQAPPMQQPPASP